MAGGVPSSLQDADKDAIDVLPLSMIRFDSMGLRRTRMIKNYYLDSVLEIFQDRDIGSGQIKITEARNAFHDVEKDDMDKLMSLASLPSFDVYNLRIQLPRLDIEVIDETGLRLSPAMTKMLDRQLTIFIRPLIINVFGDQKSQIRSYDDVIKLFNNPDPQKTLANLRLLSRKLAIELLDVPQFLAELAEIFLSVSYYRRCLAEVLPTLSEFERSVKTVRDHNQLRYDQNLIDNCDKVLSTLQRLAGRAARNFKNFDESLNFLWREMDGDKFRKFGADHQNTQVNLGAILCALSVKLRAWTRRFPNERSGTPQKWADFISTHMRQGLEQFSPAAR